MKLGGEGNIEGVLKVKFYGHQRYTHHYLQQSLLFNNSQYISFSVALQLLMRCFPLVLMWMTEFFMLMGRMGQF